MSIAQRKHLPHIAAVMLLLAVFGFYFETWRSMAAVWVSSSTFLHGAVILPISAFLIWQMRSSWIGIPPRSSLVGLMLLVLSVMAWRVADVVAVQVVGHFAVVAMLITAIWTVYGTRVVRLLHFPLLYAFFAVPFGGFLIPSLMDWTASFTVFALQLTGIPVLRDGNFFSLPSGNFQVIEVCSGVRYLIVTLVLGLLFAHEFFESQKKRMIFVLVAAVMVIIANGLRAYFVVLLAHYSEMEYGGGHEHIYMGYAIFLVTIFFVFWLGKRYEDKVRPEEHESCLAREANQSWREVISWKLAILFIVSFTVLASARFLPETQVLPSAAVRLPPQLPKAVGDWAGPSSLELSYRPAFIGESSYLAGHYEKGAHVVELHVVFYNEQQQGAELVGYKNKLIDSNVWRTTQLSSQSAKSSSAAAGLSTNKLALTNGRQAIRLWYWYEVGGRSALTAGKVKVLQAWNALTGKAGGDAVVIMATPVVDLLDNESTLQEFIDTHLVVLNACLRPSAKDDNRCAPIAAQDSALPRAVISAN
jgi:exosortase A